MKNKLISSSGFILLLMNSGKRVCICFIISLPQSSLICSGFFHLHNDYHIDLKRGVHGYLCFVAWPISKAIYSHQPPATRPPFAHVLISHFRIEAAPAYRTTKHPLRIAYLCFYLFSFYLRLATCPQISYLTFNGSLLHTRSLSQPPANTYAH